MYKAEFNSRSAAFSFANGCEKRYWVVLGDNAKFWVVRPVDGEKLITAGYVKA